MEFKAIYRYARVSPKKARLVMDLVRGRSANDALKVLRVTPNRGAYYIDKLLRSAIANADESLQADMESLRVKDARVDTGPTLKRWRSRSRGQAGMVLKRSSHLTIVLCDEPK
ncbi:MAG TPA: 50S ribosomal protein L22 [Candidatus Brocadiia bacterium]|nr:50S ribosomal protein L22 [Candidatus Brocadiia bacterium]